MTHRGALYRVCTLTLYAKKRVWLSSVEVEKNMNAPSSKPPALSGLLLWIFVISGFAGLIYQSIWAQYLGLILGHSAYAQVLVLALFMGGMALGAWWISRRSELLKKPLMLY